MSGMVREALETVEWVTVPHLPETDMPPIAAPATNKRIMPKTKAPRGPNGERLCRWCHGIVPPTRRTFCSQACVNEWRIRRDPSYVRDRLWERDKGVCAICGIDTTEVSKAINELKAATRLANPCWDYVRSSALSVWLRNQGIAGRRHLWDADHIKPVVEGGGGCGLENFRTLCVWCHKRETAKLARRLAKARRPQQELPFPDEA